MSKTAKILIIFLCALAVAAGVMVVVTMNTAKSLMKNPESAFATQAATTITDDQGNVSELKTGTYNILLLGIDSDVNRVQSHLGERSDMIMLCSVDMETNKVTMLSVPRDSYSYIDKLDVNTGDVVKSYYNKINAAYGSGGGTKYFGAKNSMNCVSRFLSCDGKLTVNVNYYFTINMDGITELCDALGGVEVKLTETIHYIDSGGKPTSQLIGNKGDTVTLKGDAAKTFVRARKEFAGGDNVRVKHQQQFMMALAQKVKTMGVDAVPALFSQFQEFASTNLTLDQVTALAGILSRINLEDVEFMALKGNGATVNGSWVLKVDEADKYEKVKELLYKETA